MVMDEGVSPHRRSNRGRHVRLPIGSESVAVNLRQLDVLQEIASSPYGDFNSRRFAASERISVGTVRNAIKGLVERGLVAATPRWLPNGGQAENGYVVTRPGLSLLDSAARRPGLLRCKEEASRS